MLCLSAQSLLPNYALIVTMCQENKCNMSNNGWLDIHLLFVLFNLMAHKIRYIFTNKSTSYTALTVHGNIIILSQNHNTV